ncbi:MAG: hypothetical protein J0M10_08435 [Chitinophagales bacterium]|nr:hypothetical protein [Chitinophagales bacterium]
MKQFFLSLLIVLGVQGLVAAQAYEGNTDYDKKKQPAFLIDYPYPAEAVENAIVKKMGRLGYKSKEEKGLFNKDKGFRNFKDAFITDISSDKMDYIIKVESKGKKTESAVIYLIIMKEGVNAKTTMDAYQTDRVKNFLNSLLPDVVAEKLELDIIAQEEAIAKAEKKLRGLKDDQQDLEKKLKNNQSDQQDTEKEIESKKQGLEALKAKRVMDKT